MKESLSVGDEKMTAIESVNVKSGVTVFVMLFEMVSGSAIESRTVC